MNPLIFLEIPIPTTDNDSSLLKLGVICENDKSILWETINLSYVTSWIQHPEGTLIFLSNAEVTMTSLPYDLFTDLFMHLTQSKLIKVNKEIMELQSDSDYKERLRNFFKDLE